MSKSLSARCSPALRSRWLAVRNTFVAPALLILTLMIGLGFVQRDEPQTGAKSDSDFGLVVNTIVARTEKSIKELRTFTGLIKAKRASDLSFERGGKVSRVLVTEGEVVAAGAKLAELAQERLELKKSTLEDTLKRLRSELNDLEPDLPTSTPEEQQRKVQQLRADLNAIQKDLDAQSRLTTGQRSGTAPLPDRLTNLERQLAIANEASRQEKISSHEQRITEMDSELKDLNLQLKEGVLLSPFEGIVALRYINEGTVVSAGVPIVRVVQRTPLEAWVGVPIDLAARVPLGQDVTVVVSDQKFNSKVRARLPELDQNTRTRTVILEIDPTASDQILPGEVARVEIRTDAPVSGIRLPLSALSRDVGGLWSVFVVEKVDAQELVSRRIVEVLHVDGNRAVVRGTLEDGERVIANGTHRVVAGQQVRSRPALSVDSSQPANRDSPE